MSLQTLDFENVTFAWEGSSETLFQDLTASFVHGWTGICGENGIGKSTLLRLAAGKLQAERGTVSGNEGALYCEQRTDEPDELAAQLLSSSDSEARYWAGKLDVQPGWLDRWPTLSHGERKRIQMAVALWQQPAALAIDEPTNHLDFPSRQLVLEALQEYWGIGLVVSHDRELLDTLCQQCLLLRRGSATLRPGNYTQALEAERVERLGLERKKSEAQRQLQKLEAEADKRKRKAMNADKQFSRRKVGLWDFDTKQKIAAARYLGRDGKAGQLQKQLAGRIDRLKGELDDIRLEKEIELKLWIQTEPSRRNAIARVDEGEMPLGEETTLFFPHLELLPTDRIGLVGPNGCGKSTLLRWLRGLTNEETERVLYLPQEISKDEGDELLRDIKGWENRPLGALMQALANLGSDPKRLLASDSPSPGEVRKLLIARGVARAPSWIILDEPTNHLDLPSIERLEAALQACQVCLLVASHDRRFLENTVDDYWSIERADPRSYRLERGRERIGR